MAEEIEVQRYNAALETLRTLGYTWSGGKQFRPPPGKAPDFDLLDHLHTRVQKLENELIEESKRTAEYKLRAQQLDQQHIMQYKMRQELEAMKT